MRLFEVNIHSLYQGFADGRLDHKTINGVELSNHRKIGLMSTPCTIYRFHYQINERIAATGRIEFHFISTQRHADGVLPEKWVADSLKYVNPAGSEYLIGRTDDFRIDFPVELTDPAYDVLVEFIDWTKQAIITYAKKHFTKGL